MVELTIIAWLVGAVLSLRLNVFALVPAISLMLVFVAVAEISRGETIWWTAASMLSVAISAQVGYLGTSILRFIVGRRSQREANPRGSPDTPKGHSAGL
jgi:hypothetical protein